MIVELQPMDAESNYQGITPKEKIDQKIMDIIDQSRHEDGQQKTSNTDNRAEQTLDNSIKAMQTDSLFSVTTERNSPKW